MADEDDRNEESFDGGATQQIDLEDVDLASAMEAAGVARPSRRPTPPPLPPSLPPVHTPSQAPSPSSAPPSPSVSPSMAPSMAPAPPPRSGVFYGLILAGLLVVGIVAGAVVAYSRKGTAAARPAPSGSAAPAVINLPTVDMADDDAGP